MDIAFLSEILILIKFNITNIPIFLQILQDTKKPQLAAL